MVSRILEPPQEQVKLVQTQPGGTPSTGTVPPSPARRSGSGVVPATLTEKDSRPDTVPNDPKLFINRELSWLAFNERVLDEGKGVGLPLLERLKFLAIVASNLDEFFMVRVAGLKQQILGNVLEAPADGMLPAEQFAAVADKSHALIADHAKVWLDDMLPALAAAGLTILRPDQLDPEQKAATRTHFLTNVFPALTPLAVDPGHPFPHLRNKSINIAVVLRKQGRKRQKYEAESLLAVVQVPAVLGRLVKVPTPTGQAFALLEELIASYAGELFPGYQVKQTAIFRVTRNWDLSLDEEESEDLLSTIQAELRRRDRGAAVRLEVTADSAQEIERILTDALRLGATDVYRMKAPLQVSDLLALGDYDPRPELRVESISPAMPRVLRDADSVVQVIADRDILLHHPYESFDPVLRFVEEAAEDPNVLAIKQTLYRTSGDSPIVRALSRAADNGKQVTAFVEIKARFDEANNIAWARRLEENGVHVVYGLIGLKTHCKVALVVRREGAGIRRYVHLGTGNYNPQTARLYTDLSFFTARVEVTEDVSALFNMLTGYAEPPQWKKLEVAPFGLQTRILGLIDREAELARTGQPARIVAKMNSLVEPAVIRALYAASGAGVDIDLLVRGICCLRPGIPGVSDRIRVTSIVDRFLEHSRIFAFGAGDRTEVYLSSADWMPRNFQRRIELMYPVEGKALRNRLLEEVLGVALRDNQRARRLGQDGVYTRVDPAGTPVRSQMVLLEAAQKSAEAAAADVPLIRPAAPVEAPPR
jgi:polyphosphate kinase